MPHQYGIPGYGQTPPSPPTHHGGALIPRLGGGAVIPVSANTNAGSMGPSGNALFRGPIEERRLTREAMEKYLRDRNNMVIVILHAKVIIYSSLNHHHHQQAVGSCSGGKGKIAILGCAVSLWCEMCLPVTLVYWLYSKLHKKALKLDEYAKKCIMIMPRYVKSIRFW